MFTFSVFPSKQRLAHSVVEITTAHEGIELWPHCDITFHTECFILIGITALELPGHHVLSPGSTSPTPQ